MVTTVFRRVAVAAATFTIRVTAGNQTTEVSSTPTYEVTRPNGTECPPECRNARVTVPL